MGLFLGFEQNEGMHIPADSGTLDLIVRKIAGPQSCRKVDIEVKAGGASSYLRITAREGLVKIAEGVYIGVREKKGQRSARRVDLHYSGHYRIEKRKYE
jgi:hypothetical protein